MVETYLIYPVGMIRKRRDDIRIEIYPKYAEALMGLNQFSHIHVLYWLHVNDTPDKRETLLVHPRKNPANPLTGVFATHSPRRPNPIALSRCKIKAVSASGIEIDDIDAFDGSPVIDIKAFFPPDPSQGPVRFPRWE